MMFELLHYVTPTGDDPFQSWIDELQDLKARVAVLRRVDRMSAGNFGDHKFLRDGVWELRVAFGPGYRVYYGKHGRAVVILLCAGAKRTQGYDIARAVDFLAEYHRSSVDPQG
jgi:putative addiction module killer protein